MLNNKIYGGAASQHLNLQQLVEKCLEKISYVDKNSKYKISKLSCTSDCPGYTDPDNKECNPKPMDISDNINFLKVINPNRNCNEYLTILYKYFQIFNEDQTIMKNKITEGLVMMLIHEAAYCQSNIVTDGSRGYSANECFENGHGLGHHRLNNINSLDVLPIDRNRDEYKKRMLDRHGNLRKFFGNILLENIFASINVNYHSIQLPHMGDIYDESTGLCYDIKSAYNSNNKKYDVLIGTDRKKINVLIVSLINVECIDQYRVKFNFMVDDDGTTFTNEINVHEIKNNINESLEFLKNNRILTQVQYDALKLRDDITSEYFVKFYTYVKQSGVRRHEYWNKYLKYKNKYLELKNRGINK